MYSVNYDVVNIFEMQNNKLGTDFCVGLWAACANRPLQNVNTAAHCPRLANKSHNGRKILVLVRNILVFVRSILVFIRSILVFVRNIVAFCSKNLNF